MSCLFHLLSQIWTGICPSRDVIYTIHKINHMLHAYKNNNIYPVDPYSDRQRQKQKLGDANDPQLNPMVLVRAKNAHSVP